MKVGDLVRCKVTKAENTIGLVVDIEYPEDTAAIFNPAVVVLTSGQKHRWSMSRMEVINESR